MTFEISSELDGRLKHKGMHEDRLNALEKFFQLQNIDEKHGLNVKTEMQFIDYDNALNEGKTIIQSRDEHTAPVKIYSWNEFMHDGSVNDAYKKTVEKYMQQKYADSQDNSREQFAKIHALHLALSNIRIIVIEDDQKKNIEIQRTIEGHSYNHTLIVAGDGCDLKIYMKTTHPKDSQHNQNAAKCIITDYVDFIAGKNSNIEFIEHRDLSSRDVIAAKKNAVLEDFSTLKWINIDKDSRLSIVSQHAMLNGEGSQSIMNNIICGKDSEYYIYNISDHHGKSTSSLMQNSTVLESSKAIVKGLVKINKDAPASNGYQKSDALMLDESSRIISIPDLEIHNHDVKCTHGSTITRLDREKIFYLQSRGMEKELAQSLLIEGFYSKALGNISDESLRESIKDSILSRE